MKKIKLFCLPYAGGSATIYLKWRQYLNDNIEIYPVELPGRGARFNEKPYTNVKDMIEDISITIMNEINDCEFMIFGHSMGAILAYELIHKFNIMGIHKPKHAFFSGRGAPHLPVLKEDAYLLPEDEFTKKVFSLGGMPRLLLEQKEILNIFIKILKADYEAIEKYEYSNRDYKFEFPISVLNGVDDLLTQNCISQWDIHTMKECDIYNFKGGHFFINDYIKEITEIILSKI